MGTPGRAKGRVEEKGKRVKQGPDFIKADVVISVSEIVCNGEWNADSPGDLARYLHSQIVHGVAGVLELTDAHDIDDCVTVHVRRDEGTVRPIR